MLARTNDDRLAWYSVTPEMTGSFQRCPPWINSSNLLSTVEAALRPFGEVRTRQWGEVVSIELKNGGKTVFSFQIASGSAQLQPPTTLPWSDIALDSLPDLVASKMVALVERGAPRDFRDIYVLCHAGLTEPGDCWKL